MTTLELISQPNAVVQLKADSNPFMPDVTKDLCSSSGSSASDSSVGRDAYSSSVSSVSSVESPSTTETAKKVDGYTSYYPHPTTFKLSDHAIDETRPLKVSRSQSNSCTAN
jgi:hypothetical protein